MSIQLPGHLSRMRVILKFALSSLAVCLLVPLAGCDDDSCHQVERCDIRQEACQRSVMAAVACMRGSSNEDLPAVSVITEREFVEREASYDEEEDAMQMEAREAQADVSSRALALFKLSPEHYQAVDARSDRATQIAAAYFRSSIEANGNDQPIRLLRNLLPRTQRLIEDYRGDLVLMDRHGGPDECVSMG